ICKLSFKVIHSTTLLLPAWIATLKDLDLPVKKILHDCPTRWNLSFDLINFVVDYRAPIKDMTDKRKLGLITYALDDHEWQLLGQLRDILKDATLFFSHGAPSLAMVIPAIDYIDEMFAPSILSNNILNPAIKAAIKQARKTLNRYYKWTDASDLYCIAMGTCFVCI
ncbi:hypothetical protein SCLCIDRAFT_105396, partial [Scleroderma citrinum Foug A]